ncbi:hypothetical protein BC937DRAFT_87683 [Endogone sp. FLAS-F59071]|nr:hypothetical protein BC937DRAFT_87683 [Endogone sp. FLAS-F59071]|eukprot:RUS22701.1 hypothetical protein BC937DRAFT_87683 [Endogone sp. FLAS-F59071]
MSTCQHCNSIHFPLPCRSDPPRRSSPTPLRFSMPLRSLMSLSPPMSQRTLVNPPAKLQRIRVGPAPRFRALLSDSTNSNTSASGSKSSLRRWLDGAKSYMKNNLDGAKSYVKNNLIRVIADTILSAIAAVIFNDLAVAPLIGLWNELSLERGSRPKQDIGDKEFISRPTVLPELKCIFNPPADYSFYHNIVGEHGTGKTTVVKEAARLILVTYSPKRLGGRSTLHLQRCSIRRYLELLSITVGLSGFQWEERTKIFQKSKLHRVQEAFRRGAARYKAMNGGNPPVLILDNISTLGKKYPEALNGLQDDAKDSYVVVFVSSEEVRSSWSRAEDPTIIGDVTKEEALKYLNKLEIKKEDAESLYELEHDVRHAALNTVKKSFEEAKMMRSSGRNFDVGKPVILELLKEGTGSASLSQTMRLLMSSCSITSSRIIRRKIQLPSSLVWQRHM